MIEVDLISAQYPGFNVTIANSALQQGCSYNLIMTDESVISEPLYDRGEVEYFLLDIDKNETKLGSGSKGGQALLSLCSTGTHQLRQRIIIRELVNNCPGQVLYQEYYDFEYNILEWKPQFKLQDFSCCLVKGVETTIVPSAININNNICLDTPEADRGFVVEGEGSFDPGGFASWNSTQKQLSYVLEYYDHETQLWTTQPDLNAVYSVHSTNVQDYPLVFVPSELTKYRLTATISNCCLVIEDVLEFTVCDAIRLEESSCGNYVIINSTNSDVSYTITDLIAQKEISSSVLNADSSDSISFSEDSVYQISWVMPDTNEQVNSVVNVMCAIDACRTGLQKIKLCEETSTGCCNESFIDERLNIMISYYDTYVSLIEPYADVNRRFTVGDVESSLSEFMRIGKIRDYLLSICNICQRYCNGCYDWEQKGCL